jgi:nitrite reductase/ring-hydroxylating ferredoxin subunit
MEEATAPRQRAWTTPAGVPLCRLDQLTDPGARNFVLQIGEAYFHGFVVRKDGQAHGYVDRCPHAGFPLAQRLDAYLTRDGQLIQCSWHGALFRPEDGLCIGGPCGGARLTPWPVEVADGMVRTA